VSHPGSAAEPILSIRDLVVDFPTDDGIVHAVDHVSYDIFPGEAIGVVGESGSGKSVTFLAVMGLLDRSRVRISGQALLAGRNLLTMSPSELRQVRGNEIAMIFQDPGTSLNPVMRVGEQIGEAILAHDETASPSAAARRSVGLLDLVGVPDAATRVRQFPHEFSGGMRQRVMIAMALANGPRVLIADEPTTALDVTIQAQVMEILRAAQQETGAATILITHDLGLVSESAARVAVMYAGRLAEIGPADEIFARPAHPYTTGLMSSLPDLSGDPRRLVPIQGQPPSLLDVPSGCAFHPRCALRNERAICAEERPVQVQVSPGHAAACHFHDEVRLRGISGAAS
jgi:oligopeptide/dipeptide ABC transporter ATP-binding protein